jgi:hypothetical protein
MGQKEQKKKNPPPEPLDFTDKKKSTACPPSEGK